MGKHGPELGLCFPRERKAGLGNSLGLATVDNVGGLWAIGAVPRGLAIGPGRLRAEEVCVRVR